MIRTSEPHSVNECFSIWEIIPCVLTSLFKTACVTTWILNSSALDTCFVPAGSRPRKKKIIINLLRNKDYGLILIIIWAYMLISYHIFWDIEHRRDMNIMYDIIAAKMKKMYIFQLNLVSIWIRSLLVYVSLTRKDILILQCRPKLWNQVFVVYLARVFVDFISLRWIYDDWKLNGVS